MKGMNNLGGMPRKYKASTGLKLLKPKLKKRSNRDFFKETKHAQSLEKNCEIARGFNALT